MQEMQDSIIDTEKSKRVLVTGSNHDLEILRERIKGTDIEILTQEPEPYFIKMNTIFPDPIAFDLPEVSKKPPKFLKDGYKKKRKAKQKNAKMARKRNH